MNLCECCGAETNYVLCSDCQNEEYFALSDEIDREENLFLEGI